MNGMNKNSENIGITGWWCGGGGNKFRLKNLCSVLMQSLY